MMTYSSPSNVYGGAAVLPVDHLVADLEVHRDPRALLEPAGPTAMISPWVGFSFAVSGMYSPPRIDSVSSAGR